MQFFPFPVNPTLQEQRYDPALFWQLAFTLHTEGEALHSSISLNRKHKNKTVKKKASTNRPTNLRAKTRPFPHQPPPPPSLQRTLVDPRT